MSSVDKQTTFPTMLSDHRTHTDVGTSSPWRIKYVCAQKTHKPKKHPKVIVLLISREWLIIKRTGTIKRIGPVINSLKVSGSIKKALKLSNILDGNNCYMKYMLFSHNLNTSMQIITIIIIKRHPDTTLIIL